MKIAAALAAMVAIAGKVSVRAAHVDALKSASANVKMPTIGQDSVGTCSPGSGKACCEAAARAGDGRVDGRVVVSIRVLSASGSDANLRAAGVRQQDPLSPLRCAASTFGALGVPPLRLWIGQNRGPQHV